MQDVVDRLDVIAHEIRLADRTSALLVRDKIEPLFATIINRISRQEDLRVQAEGAEMLCFLYLSDVQERTATSTMRAALASVQRLRLECLRAVPPTGKSL